MRRWRRSVRGFWRAIPERPPDAADASEFVRQTIGLSASAREATLARG
jgi:hypothetical protein